jgi:dihydropyrimidinase
MPHSAHPIEDIFAESNSGLENGTFTIYSSDHCPFRYDDPRGKPSGVLEDAASMEGEHHCTGYELQSLLKRKQGSFRLIPNGIPGVETRLPLLYTGALSTDRITPQRFVELTSTNPAKLVRLTIFVRQGSSLIDRSMDFILERVRLCLVLMPIWSL